MRASYGWGFTRDFRTQLQGFISIRLTEANEVDAPLFRYENVESATTLGLEAGPTTTSTIRMHVDTSYSFVRARNNKARQPLAAQASHKETVSWRDQARSVGFSTKRTATFARARPFPRSRMGRPSRAKRRRRLRGRGSPSSDFMFAPTEG